MSVHEKAANGASGAAAGGIGKLVLPWALFAVTAAGFIIYALVQANEPNVSEGNVGEEAVAIVDDEKITANEVYQLMLKEVGVQAVDQLILERLVNREAARQNITVSNDEVDAELDKIKQNMGITDDETFRMSLEMYGLTLEKFKEQLKQEVQLNKLVEPQIQITDEDLQNYYDENRSQFVITPGRVKASHILVDSREQAEGLLAELKGGADFAALAKEHSKDGSAEQGGDLGFFGRGAMVAPFEEAAFALGVGDISDVVESPGGFHIIKVTDKEEEVVAPFDEKKEEIRGLVREEKLAERKTAYIDELKTAAKIENALEPREQTAS